MPSLGFALGVRIADQDAHATARGNAFAATADNASAIYYNPAGITQLEGVQLSLNTYTISLQSRVNPDAPGDNTRTKSEIEVVPQFFATYKAQGTPLAFGLGVYTPFGLGLEYPDDTPFRTLAKEGRLTQVTINPVAAWQILPTLSLAAGPTINTGRIQLSQGVVIPGDDFNFRGQGTGYGFSAGLLWKPLPQHAFGLTYRSAYNVDFSGHTHLRIPGFSVPTPIGKFPVPGISRDDDADLDFNFPQSFVVGYSFRPTPLWNLEFNWDWTDWDSLNTLNLRQSTSGAVPIGFNWKSSSFYEFGLTRQLPAGFSVSAGYIYSENSVPNAGFNPLIPDSNRHIFSLGIGQRIHNVSWDLSYQYAYGPSRQVENGTLASGTYRFESNALSLNVGYHF